MWITHSNILNCMHQDFPAHFSTNGSSSKAPYKDLSPVVFFFSLVTVRQPHLFIWWGTVVQIQHFVQKLQNVPVTPMASFSRYKGYSFSPILVKTNQMSKFKQIKCIRTFEKGFLNFFFQITIGELSQQFWVLF